MKLHPLLRRPATAALFALLPALSTAQESSAPADPPAGEASAENADVESLGKAAARFVAAFNAKDAATIASLFLPAGEMIGGDGTAYRGRGEIETR